MAHVIFWSLPAAFAPRRLCNMQIHPRDAPKRNLRRRGSPQPGYGPMALVVVLNGACCGAARYGLMAQVVILNGAYDGAAIFLHDSPEIYGDHQVVERINPQARRYSTPKLMSRPSSRLGDYQKTNKKRTLA